MAKEINSRIMRARLGSLLLTYAYKASAREVLTVSEQINIEQYAMIVYCLSLSCQKKKYDKREIDCNIGKYGTLQFI